MTKPDFGPPPAAQYDIYPSAAEIAFFREHGFLAVERLTTDAEIAWLRQIFEFIFSAAHAGQRGAPVDRSGVLAPGEASRLQQAFFPELEFPALLQTNHWRNAKRYAAALLDVPEAQLSSWGHMIRKPVGGRAALWHQDHAYWQPEFDYHALGVWLPMHDVSVEMGAMQFIPGSHKRGMLRHRHADAPEHNVLEVDEPFDPAHRDAMSVAHGWRNVPSRGNPALHRAQHNRSAAPGLSDGISNSASAARPAAGDAVGG